MHHHSILLEQFIKQKLRPWLLNKTMNMHYIKISPNKQPVCLLGLYLIR
jgi:hypothetical protein